MKNLYFPDEDITKDDLYFLCYMTERVARRLHQRNRYVVNRIGREELVHLLSVANVLHSENPLKVEQDWIDEYGLEEGTFHVEDVDPELVTQVPTALQMGKDYMRLILDTEQPGEDFADGMIRVYNDPICEVIDNYNCSAYYEPSYVIARAYNEGGF